MSNGIKPLFVLFKKNMNSGYCEFQNKKIKF